MNFYRVFCGTSRKILKLFDYFVVKFELISSIEVKYAFEKIGDKLQNFEKNSRKIGKISRKFYITFGKSCRKSVEFQIKFRERLKVKHQNKI